jgi:hypothetical protein
VAKGGLTGWRKWAAHALLRLISLEMVLLWKCLSLDISQAEQELGKMAADYMRNRERERLVGNGTPPPTRH